MIKKIVKDKEFLHQKSTEVPFRYDISGLIKDLKDTLRASITGVGIAAPQIGVLNKVFYLDSAEFRGAFINPVIIDRWGRDVIMDESCLSIPKFSKGGLFRPVKVVRKQGVTIRYYDENWRQREIKTSGFLSRLIQHEYDHFLGILCIDRSMNNEFSKTFEQFIKNNY